MTTGGGTSTVFVLEGVNANAKPAPVVKAPTVSKKAIGTGAAKTGAAAYDDFIDPVRELLVKAWESEVDAIKRAIKDDEERGRMAKTPKERQHFERNIADYKARLARVEKNDPPYVNLDVLKKRK
jgi:hypothetical protein